MKLEKQIKYMWFGIIFLSIICLGIILGINSDPRLMTSTEEITYDIKYNEAQIKDLRGRIHLLENHVYDIGNEFIEGVD